MRSRYLIKLFELISVVTSERCDIFCVPAKVIAGQQVTSTLYFLRSLVGLVQQPPAKIEEAVETVLREGEVKIYQRAVRVRVTVTRMQAIMRGRRERREMEVKKSITPILSTATTPATDSRPRTEGQESSSSGGEEHMVMATLRGPRAMIGGPKTGGMEMMPMEESVDFEDSMESAVGGSLRLETNVVIKGNEDDTEQDQSTSVVYIATPKPPKSPVKPIVPISPDTEEESLAPIPVAKRRVSSIDSAAPSASFSTVATPKTQEDMDFEMLEAHRVLEGEMEKLKGAMEKERERQRERVRERMREKKREGKDDYVGGGQKETGPVVFYPTYSKKNELEGGQEVKKEKVEKKKVARIAKDIVIKKKTKGDKEEEPVKKKPPLPSFTRPAQPRPASKNGGKADERINEIVASAPPVFKYVERQVTRESDPEIKRVKEDMINAKRKYTTSLKKVLAKEQNLTKKEGELKKKEERVTKLADNLRRQRVMLKKEMVKVKKPSEMIKQIAQLTPVKAPVEEKAKVSVSPPRSSPTTSPNRYNGNVMKAPKQGMTERGVEKMGKLMSVYAGAGAGSKGDKLSQDRYTRPEFSPNKLSQEDEDMKAYQDKFLAGKGFKGNMGLMGLAEATSTMTPSIPSPSPKFSAYKAPNPLLQPPASTIGSGPLSTASAFGMNDSGGGDMVKKWTDEYNKEMKRRMEEKKAQGVGLGGVRSLSMGRSGVVNPVRSKSARPNEDVKIENLAQVGKEDSESSRESRSAPEERRDLHTSLDLLIGSSEKAGRKGDKEGGKRHGGRGRKKKFDQKSKGKMSSGTGGGITKRETRIVRGRSKKKTPTKPLGRSPLRDIKKSSASPVRMESSLSQEEIDKAKGNLNHILARKRMPLADVIKASSGGFIKANKLRQELDEIMGDFGFGDGVEGIMELSERCLSRDHPGIVDIKALERWCRVVRKGDMKRGVATGIVTKQKAKEVYEGYTFSFEKTAEVGPAGKENEGNIFGGKFRDEEDSKPALSTFDGTKFPWLASFDQRMLEVLKDADTY